MDMKKILYITLLTIASTFTLVAIAQLQEPGNGIESNAEYRELREADRRLSISEDSVEMVVAATREQFKLYVDSLHREGLQPSQEEFNRHNDRIWELEQEIFDIRTMRGDIISRINVLEQDWVISQMNSSTEEEPTTESVVEEVIPACRNLVDNHIFKTSLSREDYAELLVAHAEDQEMEHLIAEYANIYAHMADTAEQYLASDNETEAEELFKQFQTLKQLAETVASKIDSRWNHILDTKYFAYGYILERERQYDLLDASSVEFTNMRRECSREAGYYASDAVMHYAKGRPTLRKFEHDFAQTMGLEIAADSIATVRNEAEEVAYNFEPITLERRLFIDYQPITIGRTNFYKDSNPIPALKVYERGVIYRILLGKFRNKQPMTLFKGVQPLYIERDKEGYYLYYAGGFATRLEADEAVLFLKEKGFKAPEICRWQNGAMVNLMQAVADDDASGDIPITGKHYMVKIGVEDLSEEVTTLLSTEAPDKRISKTSGGFTVGTFQSQEEADMLVTILSESSDAQIEVVEIELN